MVINSIHEDFELFPSRYSKTLSKSSPARFYLSIITGQGQEQSFVKLDMSYADYFPEYAQYFGIALNVLKSMYGMTNSGKLFADELTEWLIEEGFMQITMSDVHLL